MMNEDFILDADFHEEGENKIDYEIVAWNKFLILYTASFGFYGIWWIYRMWTFFKEKESLDIMPVSRAIFGILFLYPLFEKIKQFAQENNVIADYSSGNLFIGVFLFFLAGYLPDPFWLISFIAMVFHFSPINAFNQAIEKSNIFRIIDSEKFNQKQIIIIIIGALIWGLFLMDIFFPEELEVY